MLLTKTYGTKLFLSLVQSLKILSSCLEIRMAEWSGPRVIPRNPILSHFFNLERAIVAIVLCRKNGSICQHTIAAAEDIGILEKHLEFFHRLKEPLNMMASARRNAPSNAGQKPGQKQRKPRGRGQSRNEGEHAQRTPTSSKSSNSYNLRWLAETRAYICYLLRLQESVACSTSYPACTI